MSCSRGEFQGEFADCIVVHVQSLIRRQVAKFADELQFHGLKRFLFDTYFLPLGSHDPSNQVVSYVNCSVGADIYVESLLFNLNFSLHKVENSGFSAAFLQRQKK